MSVDRLFVCEDCRLSLYCGRNFTQRYDEFIVPHLSHVHHDLCDDAVTERDGHLYGDGGGMVDDWLIVKDYRGFRRENIEDAP